MKKLEKNIIKIVQRLKYLYIKIKFSKMNNYKNIMMCFENKGERLSDDFSTELPVGLRKNKRFPAGKSIVLIAKENTFEVILIYKMKCVLDNMDEAGTAGVDVYVDEEDEFIYWTTISPQKRSQMYVKKELLLPVGSKSIRLFLPSFASLEGIYIKESMVDVIKKNNNVNIVLYGSSITHGCAASRPGLSYANQLSMRLGCNIDNYGFSESAKGETKLIDFISKIPAKVFIVEYDHNASEEELYCTHCSVYKTIRKHFQGWIILMTRFSGGLSIFPDEEKARIHIIENTYKYAISKGDDKIYLLDGREMFPVEKEKYFVDNVHPNDEGMNVIAEKISSIIEQKGMMK